MKTHLLFGLLVLGFWSCKSPYFSYKGELDSTKKYEEYTIDRNHYHLYVKSICIDSLDKLSEPRNCSGSRGEEVVEMEYLLMSEDSKKVLVINNLPNSHQKFFKEKSRLMKWNNRDAAEINIWYFKQFRFGTIEDDPSLVTGRHLRFTTVEKHPVTYVWQYTKTDDDVVTLVAVGEQYPDRLDNRFSEAALSLVPTFKRVENYKFVFQMPKQFKKRSASPVELPEAKWRVLRNGERDMNTYFRFDSPIYKNYKVARFNSQRMYSYYGEQRNLD